MRPITVPGLHAEQPLQPQRLRRTETLRALVRETRLHPANLVAPLFVVADKDRAGPIPSLPGVDRHDLAGLAAEAVALSELGLGGVLLFGVESRKDERASAACAVHGNLVADAVRAVRDAAPGLCVMTDVCLCGYTSHGHCGVLRGDAIDGPATLEQLGAMAVRHAEAGADLVAPSAMLDGQVAAVRSALDAAGHGQTGIMSYAVKYASSFYGPFRDAVGSAPAAGDRRGHQMDPANRREALLEARLDREQGADVLMVKPAQSYLDVVADLRRAFPDAPLAAYQVSGEYAMLHAAAERGWLDLRAAGLESLLAIRRAGADIVITYLAARAAQWLREGNAR